MYSVPEWRSYRTRVELRHMLGNWLRNFLYRRVFLRGRGSSNHVLKGYSKRPLSMRMVKKPGAKDFITPKGGTPTHGGSMMFFQGGYAEYVDEIGQDASMFNFTNTGKAAADFRYFRTGSLSSPVEIGFKDSRNVAAAEAASATRPTMWRLSPNEMNKAAGAVTRFLMSTVFGRKERKMLRGGK